MTQDPGLALPSGGYFKFLEPETSEFEIEDIAHNLSHVCRYGGGSKYHFSVAQHCVNASFIVAPEFALEALLHDAAEAFFGDMTSPLKRLCRDYVLLLEAAEVVVARRFGVPERLSPEVKLADMQLLKLEKEHLVPTADNYHRAAWPDWDGYELAPELHKFVTLRELTHKQARTSFLLRFEALTNG